MLVVVHRTVRAEKLPAALRMLHTESRFCGTYGGGSARTYSSRERTSVLAGVAMST
jgi:hypothetical protein